MQTSIGKLSGNLLFDLIDILVGIVQFAYESIFSLILN